MHDKYIDTQLDAKIPYPTKSLKYSYDSCVDSSFALKRSR